MSDRPSIVIIFILTFGDFCAHHLYILEEATPLIGVSFSESDNGHGTITNVIDPSIKWIPCAG